MRKAHAPLGACVIFSWTGSGFLALAKDQAPVHRQGNQVNIETLAVVMRPDRAKLGPERAFSFAGDDEGLVGRLLGFRR
jgi:hypothetical protein